MVRLEMSVMSVPFLLNRVTGVGKKLIMNRDKTACPAKIATIVVLALISRNPTWIRVNMPASLGKPFYPGS